MSFPFARTIQIVSALMIAAPVNAQVCSLQSPEHAVFDIVERSPAQNAGEPASDQKVGTAFIIDSDQGLFATAYHILALASGPGSGKKLLITRSNFEAEFERIASGNNAGLLHDDWAILKAKLKEPNLGLHPYPAMHVAYDRPTGLELVGSSVFVSSGAVRQLSGAEWSGTDDPVKACEPANVVMLEIPSYDRGYSGSPVFSEKQCGIVGLSSRFILPSDATSPGLKETVRAFQQYTKRIDAAASARIDPDNLSLEQNLTVMRELVKDKVLVKIVPSRCMVDGVIFESYKNKTSIIGKLIRQDYSAETRKIILVMSSVDLNNPESTVLTMNMIKEARLRWVDLLQVVAAFRNAVSVQKLNTKPYYNMFTTAMAEKQAGLRYKSIDFSYSRAAASEQTIEAGIPSYTNADDTISSLIKRNFGFGTIDQIVLDSKAVYGSEIDPRNRIELGLKLSEVAEKTSIPEGAREIARKASASYIASGLAADGKLSSTSGMVSPDVKGEALARLAKSLPLLAAPGTFETANLQSRIGQAALAQQGISASGRKLAIDAIAGAEMSKFQDFATVPLGGSGMGADLPFQRRAYIDGRP